MKTKRDRLEIFHDMLKAINDKSRSCIFAGEILSADAKSGATDEITKDFRYFKVIKIMKIEINKTVLTNRKDCEVLL